MKTELEKTFDLFVGKDNLRPTMHTPFEFENYIYATDAHILIRVKKEDCDFEITNPDFLKCDDKIIPKENENIILSIPDFEMYKTEDEYKVIQEEKECDTCHGSGEVEWEFENYTKDFDCPVCEGEGIEEEEKKAKTGKKTFGLTAIKVKDTYFDIKLFNVLNDVKDYLGGDITLISADKSFSPTMFRIGICEVLLMPVRFQKENWDNVIEVI